MAGAAAGPSSSGPQPMDADGDPEDRLVAAYDVHVCAELPMLKTQLVLLQQPLRPRWRPYDLPAATAARFKPRAQRLEVDVPVEQDEANYDTSAQEHMRVPSTTLRSAPVDSGAPQAVGVIRNGRLLLMSLDYSLQLRPHMAHLNIAKDKKQRGSGIANGAAEGELSEDEAEAAAADEGAAAGPSNAASSSMTAIEVQVKRRETERQQQARLNSYSYLSQKEEEERWVQLQLHAADSRAADQLRQRAERPALERELGMALERAAYLAGFVPGAGGPQASSAPDGAAAGAGVAAANGPLASGGSGVPGAGKGEAASKELVAAITPALAVLFNKQSVCSLGNVRTHLARWEGMLASTVHQGALLEDRALQEVVTSTAAITLVRRVFVRVKGAKPEDDKMRELVIRMLREQDAIKKGDISKQAGVEAVPWSEAAYLRVVKDLCVSKGNSWSLKAGADGM